MLFTLTGLIIVTILSIHGLIYAAIDKQKTKRAVATGFMYAIFYKLRNGQEVFILKCWRHDEAEEFAAAASRNQSNVSSIINHKDFKEVTNEEFDGQRLLIRRVRAGPRPYPSYFNNGIKQVENS
jgi:hypothetical protein